MATSIPDRDEILAHHQAMVGGDDTLAYTQSGEMVIPKSVQRANPGLVLAAMQTIRGMGGDPRRYIVGSKQGSYNKQTGAQQFFDLFSLEDWADFGTNTVDYVSNNDWAQAAATGALTAGAAKLTGSDNKQALAAGAGAGLGMYAGDKLSQGFDNLSYNSNNKDAITAGTISSKGFFDTPEQINSTGFLDSLGNLPGSVSSAGLTAATLGGTLGYAATAPKPNIPDMSLELRPPSASQSQLNNVPLAQPTEAIDQLFEANEAANISATLPSALPSAPTTSAGLAMTMPSGVSYKKKVKDREDGSFSYTDLEANDAASFSRALKNSSRRKGFGNKILIS
jgi:hypothetical protein